MNKLANLEKLLEYVEEAADALKEAEESLEENVLEDELESNLLDVKKALEELFENLKDFYDFTEQERELRE